MVDRLMKVKRSSGNWSVETSERAEVKKRIELVVKEFGAGVDLREFNVWKDILKEDPDEFWVKYLVGQFCVMRGIRLWENLMNGNDWDAFSKEMRLSGLVNKSDLSAYLTGIFGKFKPTIYWRKAADKIARFVKNPEVVRNGKLVLFDNLDGLDEDEKRDRLLERTKHFFKMKSISDLMIEIGMGREMVAFDTRIVGFLFDYVGLRLEPDVPSVTRDKKRARITAKVQSDENLYKKMESELRTICREIGIPLGLLDRILFRSVSMTAMQYVFRKNGYV
jgi:thermostable 8-oxoguanine DNA glycosylase